MGLGGGFLGSHRVGVEKARLPRRRLCCRCARLNRALRQPCGFVSSAFCPRHCATWTFMIDYLLCEVMIPRYQHHTRQDPSKNRVSQLSRARVASSTRRQHPPHAGTLISMSSSHGQGQVGCCAKGGARRPASQGTPAAARAAPCDSAVPRAAQPLCTGLLGT